MTVFWLWLQLPLDALPFGGLPWDALPWDALPWDALPWDALPWDALPWDATSPAPTPNAPVYPQQGQGFAAYIVGGFFGLGLLIVAMLLISLKPKRIGPND